MSTDRLVPLMLSISKDHRDLLRTIAAEVNLENPDEVISAALIGRNIIVHFLEGQESSAIKSLLKSKITGEQHVYK